MTKSFFKNKTSYTSRWIVLMIDISISLQAFFLAYLIRFNFSLKFGPHEFLQQLPMVATVTLVSFLIVGSFKGVVRHTGTKDAINVYWSATLIAVILLVSTLIFRNYNIYQYFSIPLGIIAIHYLLNIVLLISSRFIFKYLFNRIVTTYKVPKNIMIYGAGDSGILTYNTLINSKHHNYKIVGFLDDSKMKIGKQFNRIKIYNTNKIDENFIKKHQIDEIIVSIQNIKPFILFEKVDKLTQLPITIKLVPPVQQWIDGELHIGQIQEVRIEDLLDRTPIQIENPIIQKD